MSQESQSIEWKEAWQEKHLKWVCGFANAQGGSLVLGKNDRGVAVGLADAKRLLEDLPNKIRDLMGIVVEVNLIKEAGCDLIEIITPAYPSPISYRGHYYLRSGSTLQELKGASLDRFILSRQGKTWDGLPMPQVSVGDLSEGAISRFERLAGESGRLGLGASKSGRGAALLEKLRLLEGGYLKRAAVMLFHADPQSFASGASVKLAFFRSDTELAYQDEITGPLIDQPRTVLDTLTLKYLKAVVSYEGIQRIESYPVPEVALREAILNALIHRDYADAAPVQIRVYENKLRIWNPAELPEGWTQKKLLGEHPSRPFNPAIAQVFFRAGEIEAWGHGIERIYQACKQAGVPKPRIRYEPGEMTVEFSFAKSYLQAASGGGAKQAKVGEKRGERVGENNTSIVKEILANPKITVKELSMMLGVGKTSMGLIISNLKALGVLRRVGSARGGHWEISQEFLSAIPAKPGSSESTINPPKVGEKRAKKVGEKLSANREQILREMRENPRITVQALSDLLGIAPKNVEANLAFLKDGGWVKRVGPAKGGKWEVLK